VVWYNDEVASPPREVLSEFDATISDFSIMKARELENSKLRDENPKIGNQYFTNFENFLNFKTSKIPELQVFSPFKFSP